MFANPVVFNRDFPGETVLRRYFRADAAFAKPDIYEYLEERHVLYAISGYSPMEAMLL